MRKLYLDTILFIAIIFVLGSINLLNTDKPTISELEKRELSKKPVFTYTTLFDGSYFKDLENYFSDTFIYRDKMVKINKDLRRLAAGSGSGPYLAMASQTTSNQNGINTDEGPVSSPAPSQEVSDTVVNTDTAQKKVDTVKPEPPKKVYEENNNVGFWLIIDGKAVEVFQFNKNNLAYYSEVLNKYNKILGDKVKVYSMIAPTTGDFLPLRQYKNILESQNDAVGYLKSKLNDNVNAVNVYDALNRHKEEYIYFNTDHHWTSLGAYYAYTAFMDSRNVKADPLEKYNVAKVENFLGSAYAQTLDASLEKNPDRIDIYMPFTEHEYYMYNGNSGIKSDIIDMSWAESKLDKYLIFLSSGGAVWSRITTNVKNGQKILVMKDSFGNTLVPFLLPHYEEIYVIDSRFYSKAVTGMNIIQFIENKGINEVMFINCMGNVNSKEFMENIDYLAN